MLLLEILLLREVCTLLLQMETLQSRRLPAQMDFLFPICGDSRSGAWYICVLCAGWRTIRWLRQMSAQAQAVQALSA